MTDSSQRIAGGRPPRRGGHDLGPFGLIAGAWDLIQARWGRAVVLWIVGAAIVFATRAARPALGLSLLFSAFNPQVLAFSTAINVVSAILGTLILRLFLTDGPGWWRPNLGFAACAGLLAAANIVTSLWSAAVLGRASMNGLAFLGLALAVSAAGLAVQAWIYSRLLLWPVGALVGDAAMTPGRSWRLMGGRVFAFIIASLLVMAPEIIWPMISVLLFGHQLADVRTGATVFSALTGTPIRLFQLGFAAILYRALAAAPVADVAATATEG